MPAYCTAVGKVLLAYVEPKRLRTLLRAGLTRRTPRTVIALGMLMAELERVRERGFAEEHEESTLGSRAWPPPFSMLRVLRSRLLAHKQEEERSRRLAQVVDSATELISTCDLEGRISFMGIPRTIEKVLALTPAGSPASIREVLAADLRARDMARDQITP